MAPNPVVGQTISHYRVVSQLGAGGMGVVYAAEDPRLGRQVALKFVSEEMIKDASTIERLKVEARTTSALSHPNICTIYDIGEHEGRPFIVMEILKGRTLRDRLAEGPLKVGETIDLGIQVAEALVAAHGRDIIHRDIKPANIFLVDHGPVKVLDFGLAKLTAVPGSEETVAPSADLTAMGTTVGTVSYMSPEQVSGDPLDRRTDLFSLGVVLYECVTGRQPFHGKNSAVILASILTQQPAAPATLNTSVPPGLQDAIHKCLEKDRELRYQDAAGVRADLKRVKRDLDSGALRTASMRAMALQAADAAVPPPASSSAVAHVQSSASVPTAAPAPRNRTVFAVAAVAAIAIVSVGAMMLMSRHPETSPASAAATRTAEAGAAETPSTPPEPAAVAPASAPPPAASASVAPASAPPPAKAEARSEPADASRVRSTAPPSPRFTAAIVEANRLLAAGDGDGATRALNVARGLDPTSPAVADLSTRLVDFYRVEAARRSANDSARPSPAAAAPPAAPSAPPATPAPARSSEPQPANPPASAAQPTARPAVPESSPLSTALPATQRPAPPTPPAAAAEDDDAAIRRVIATYARAIENKDLALYRSVKPNLTSAEQRTIEEGFRAVTSQRVTVTIQSIEHRGQDAIVRLRRQDVIQAGGRQQSSESQQTITLTRGAGGWAIREIGR